MSRLARLVLGHQREEQEQRLEHTARVIGIMRAARTRETRQTAKLRHSGRRASSRLAHR